jgi:transcription initiation factor TFIID subunit 5
MIAISNENSSIHVYELNENKTIYTNSLKKKAKMIETGLYRELVGGHSSTVFKSKFTHDSKYLVSCGDDNTACLWNLNKTKQIKQNDTDEEEDDDDENNEENFDSKLKSCFGPNSESNASLVTCYSGHLYSIWDLELFSQLNLFVTASKDATARLWSFDRIYPLRVFAGHQSDVNCVKFHPNVSKHP